jgi:cell wall-associated NlpC family hydrolase
MPARRRRILRPVFCAAASLAMVGSTLCAAHADSTDPSRQQLDQAQQAVQNAKAAVNPAQAQYAAAQQQLAELTQHQQIAAEQYDAATYRLQQVQTAQQTAVTHLAAATVQYRQAETKLGLFAASAYQNGGNLSTLSVVLEADGPEQFAQSIYMVKHQGADLNSVERQAQQAQQTAQTAESQANAAMAAGAAAQAQVAQAAQQAQAAVAAEQAQTSVIDARLNRLLTELAAAQNLSVQLEQEHQQALAEQAAQQQQAQAQASNPAHTGAVAPYLSGPAGQALAFAYAQLGKPYVWGATGPDSYDCSGLTMRAWRAAGVGLPHFAAFQYQAGHPLTYDQLNPGDLLFWATDPKDSNTIYHEAIYVGGQQMIQAPKTGQDVEVSSIWMWGPIQFYARPD